jgi:(p)ppGpp synthase/HD superfamily hydrolase
LIQNHWEALERAVVLAITAHLGQRDKAGQPYILHLLRVMESVCCPIEKQAAILHDYLEDTDGSLAILKSNSISEDAIVAIELLTRQATMSYCDYVIALKKNEIARVVKLADIEDNYRVDRVAYRAGYESEDALRMQRYALSHQFLRHELSDVDYARRMPPLEG